MTKSTKAKPKRNMEKRTEFKTLIDRIKAAYKNKNGIILAIVKDEKDERGRSGKECHVCLSDISSMEVACVFDAIIKDHPEVMLALGMMRGIKI